MIEDRIDPGAAAPGAHLSQGGQIAGSPISGAVEFLELGTLMRFIAGVGVDGRLVVFGTDWLAALLFNAGRLTDATCGEKRGRPAFEEIWLLASRTDGPLQFAFEPELTESALTALVHPDELAAGLSEMSAQALRITSLFPSPDAVVSLVIDDRDWDAEVVLDRIALTVLVEVDNRRTVGQLARRHGQLTTLQALVRLIELELVTLGEPAAPVYRPVTSPEPAQPVEAVPARRRLETASPRVRIGAGTSVTVALGGLAWFAPAVAAVALGAAGLALPLAYALWRRAELGLLGLLALTAGLLRATDLYVPLPLGGLFPADLALLAVLAVVATRALFNEGLSIAWKPVCGPLLVFLGVCVASVVYAVAFRGVELHLALNELRPPAFYGVALLTTLAVSRRTQLNVLLIGMFVLADLIAVALVLQQFAGAGSLLLPGMQDWQVNEVGAGGVTDVGAGQSGFGLVRIVPPALPLLFFIMVFSFVRMLTSQRWVRTVFALQFALLGVGLLLTYTRALWIASFISLGLCTLVLPRPVRGLLLRAAGIFAVIAGLTLGTVAAGVPLPGGVGALLDALVSRATSTLSPQETLSSPSLQWRVFETEQALNSLAASPQGVGLGNIYRPVTTLAGEAAGYQGDEPLNRFVHNSYLYIAVKTGVLGLAVFLWFCLAFVARGWGLLRRLPPGGDRWLTLAAVTSFVGIMQWSITEANFMQTGSTVVIGLMVGIVACTARSATPCDPRGLEAA